jgi:hypothetical protein
MPPVGFEPKISAGERPQTYALDRATTGTGEEYVYIGSYTFKDDRKVKEVVLRRLATQDINTRNDVAVTVGK